RAHRLRDEHAAAGVLGADGRVVDAVAAGVRRDLDEPRRVCGRAVRDRLGRRRQNRSRLRRRRRRVACAGRAVGALHRRRLPALGPDGRFPWLPLGAFWPKVWSYVAEPFRRGGIEAQLTPWWPKLAVSILFVAVVVAAIGIVCVRDRKNAPWQPLLLLGAAVLS